MTISSYCGAAGISVLSQVFIICVIESVEGIGCNVAKFADESKMGEFTGCEMDSTNLRDRESTEANVGSCHLM